MPSEEVSSLGTQIWASILGYRGEKTAGVAFVDLISAGSRQRGAEAALLREDMEQLALCCKPQESTLHSDSGLQPLSRINAEGAGG